MAEDRRAGRRLWGVVDLARALAISVALLGGCRRQAASAPVTPFEVVRAPRRFEARDLVVDVYAVVLVSRGDRDALYLPGEGWLRLQADREELAGLVRFSDGEERLTARLHGRVRREGRQAVIDVRKVEPAPAPEPVAVRSVAQLSRRRRRFNGAYVVLEGLILEAFEVYTFSGMWLTTAGATSECTPMPLEEGRSTAVPARITGVVFTRGRHGHLGAYREELVATKVVYLGDPGCSAR